MNCTMDDKQQTTVVMYRQQPYIICEVDTVMADYHLFLGGTDVYAAISKSAEICLYFFRMPAPPGPWYHATSASGALSSPTVLQ